MFDPRDHALETTWAEARALGANDLAVRRLLAAIVGQGVFDPAGRGRSLHGPRRLGEAVGRLPRLVLDGVATSPVDGFEKLRFRTPDGLAVETVLIPLQKPGAVSVCVSSQVGCVMGCVFCATARMPRRRSLATWEILDQFIQARDRARAQGRRVTGVVFMGMGEPFLAYDQVLQAADLMRCPYGGQVGARAITISTVGLVPAIDRYTAE